MRTHAGNILGMDIKGHVVELLWIEHASDIAEEYYASFTLDRAAKQHLLMLSARGGVDIEEVASTDPDAIVKLHVNPVTGISEETARQAAVDAGIPERAVDGVAAMVVKLYRCFTEGDCDLAEINPLILRPDGEVHALDAKVSLDGNASFRHPEWAEWEATEVLDDRERLAKEKDLQYIGLDGTVGIIANGAGLAMSTLDVVNQVGGRAANFLDIGGGANADVMAAALDVINHDENVRSILVNIFGGITRGEEVATGIVEGLRRVESAGADRHPPRRDERRAGPPDHPRRRDPAVEADQQADDARRRPGGRTNRQRLGRRGVMAIFVDADTKVLVQGLTGGQGRFHGLRNRDYGTQVVAGVTPGKGGQDVDGMPVFDSVAEAVATTGATASFVAVPPKAAPAAILEAAASGHLLRRLHHRGDPGPGRGAHLQPVGARLPGHPAARPELPRRDQPGQVQHRHHPHRHRPATERRSTQRRESSAGPARSPIRRCTSSSSTASVCRRASGSAATRCRGRASSTASPSSRTTRRPTR